MLMAFTGYLKPPVNSSSLNIPQKKFLTSFSSCSFAYKNAVSLQMKN